MTLLELISSFCLSPSITDNELIEFLNKELSKYEEAKKGGSEK